MQWDLWGALTTSLVAAGLADAVAALEEAVAGRRAAELLADAKTL